MGGCEYTKSFTVENTIGAYWLSFEDLYLLYLIISIFNIQVSKKKKLCYVVLTAVYLIYVLCRA